MKGRKEKKGRKKNEGIEGKRNRFEWCSPKGKYCMEKGGLNVKGGKVAKKRVKEERGERGWIRDRRRCEKKEK